MNTLLWILFFSFALISYIPVIKLEQVKSYEKYRVLWYLSIVVFIWSVTTGLALIVSESISIYYFSMLTYPIVFLIVYFIYLTFKAYMGETTYKFFHYFALIFFIVNLLISMTNPWHQWMLTLPLSSDITNSSFQDVGRGFFFYIHTFVSYIILVIAFIKIFRYMVKRVHTQDGAFPFGMIIICIVLGIQLNIIHVFIYTFTIDPTYLFIVITTFTMYTIIYKRDFNVNLISSSRQYLLKNMREMYVIMDEDQIIIEYSKNLRDRFHLSYKEIKNLDDFIKELKSKAVLFKDKKELDHEPFDPNMCYLHMTKQSFSISRFKSKGTLILLYDETEDIKLIHEIEELRRRDLMSGLFNRNYLEANRKIFEKEHDYLGVILIDIDGLKLRNDYLGHPSGDQLIIKFANAIFELAKEYDDLIPIRLGGDEFLIIVKEADEKKIHEMMKELNHLTESKDIIEHISFSYGATTKKDISETLTILMRRADLNLYEMKETHKEIKEKVANELAKKLDTLK